MIEVMLGFGRIREVGVGFWMDEEDGLFLFGCVEARFCNEILRYSLVSISLQGVALSLSNAFDERKCCGDLAAIMTYCAK